MAQSRDGHADADGRSPDGRTEKEKVRDTDRSTWSGEPSGIYVLQVKGHQVHRWGLRRVYVVVSSISILPGHIIYTYTYVYILEEKNTYRLQSLEELSLTDGLAAIGIHI